MVHASYIFKTTSAKEESLSEVLKLIVSRTRYFSGCLKCTLWYSEDRLEMMLTELWKTRLDIERYITSNQYKRMFVAMEMSIEKPEICFCDSDQIRGFDLIEEIMSSKLFKFEQY